MESLRFFFINFTKEKMQILSCEQEKEEERSQRP